MRSARTNRKARKAIINHGSMCSNHYFLLTFLPFLIVLLTYGTHFERNNDTAIRDLSYSAHTATQVGMKLNYFEYAKVILFSCFVPLEFLSDLFAS